MPKCAVKMRILHIKIGFGGDMQRCNMNMQIARMSKEPVAVKYGSALERERCPPLPPPPPPPARDDRLFWGAMTVAFLAGSFAVYAKRSPEIRDWLTINAPWFDDFIAIVYQENMTYGEFAEQCVGDLRRYFVDYFDDTKPKQCSLDGKPVEAIPAVPDEPKKEPPSEDNKNDEESPCDVLPPPIVTKDICEIEKCLIDLGDSAINNYITARDACVYYNKLVDEYMMNFTIPKMKELHGAMDERIDLVKTSLNRAQMAIDKLNELTRYFECGVQAPKEALKATRELLKDYQTRIKAIHMEFQWENDKSTVIDRQWLMVESTLDKYTEENQTLFPGLTYNTHKPNLQGDGDLLLYHTLRYAIKLRAELDEAAESMTERVNRAVETLSQSEKELKARDALLQVEYKKGKAELDKEYKKREDDQRAENERYLKDSLKKQLERHQETLALRLEQKEKEVIVKFNKMVTEKVAAEKQLFKKQLADMAFKLKLVEDKLNAHLKAERETRRSQELWTAGASLLAATKKGEPYIRVDKELKAIEKAAGDSDKLVLTVLKAIPDSVREQGIVPESVLRDKYHVMERVALKVALIERDGSPLPVYFLSWLQSVFLFMKLPSIPQVEIDRPPHEPFKDLDTFDLLQRARFWIEHGNLAAALRYVSSLEGASRAAAATWYEAARAHLETRQAAEAVLAHAAALGLQYI